ncbi:ATP-binding protein [Actinomadura flavalba]|uniref:ATP-binding protein n=1 Tax=Actinomadura flavalba TaxID=1120938 RepID=UPI00037501FD|nr:LuxR C-terminal-related transcriptional regulator [Actinomadura flavalba]
MTTTSLEPRSGRLPAELTSFIGRRAELAEIGRMFARGRLVTLTGPGGVGKSRLAVRAADRLADDHADGVCFVDLSVLREPGLLARALGGALGLPDHNAATALDDLVAHLADRDLLLVLDTCERLVDACAILAELLLRSAPGLRILATSRQPLDIAGEHTLVVAPLAVPGADDHDPGAPCDSVDLFAERAAAVVPEWRLTDSDRGAVVLLCRRLDGIPLAIELAAVQLRALSVTQIVDRLDRRILHVRGRRTAMPRHQTLETAIGWSHELCSPGERLLWARLSVFEGGFDLDSAENVCADAELPAGEVFDLLAGLVAKSIVRPVTRGAAARYRMLDTIREYGAERLDRAGETAVLRDRAFAWFAGCVARAVPELTTAGQRRVLDWYRDEEANLRALLDHGLRTADDALLCPALLGLGRILALQGLIGEARYWFEHYLELREPQGRAGTEMLALGGVLAVLQNDPDAAAGPLAAAEERAAADDDRSGLGYVRLAQGVTALYADRMADAVTALAQARDLHAEAGVTDVLTPTADVFLAVARCLGGDPRAAQDDARRAVLATTPAGELWCRSFGLCVLGLARLLDGDAAGALDDVRAGLAVKRDLGDRLGVALALDMAAACAVSLGDAPSAARWLGVADRLRTRTGTTMFGPQHALLRSFYEGQAVEAVGEDVFTAALEAGRRLGEDSAVAEALGETAPAVGAAEAGPGRRRLTPREREIAGLVADGLTNREIADRLVIAKRTADSHVEHILAKLECTSRTQIAARLDEPG